MVQLFLEARKSNKNYEKSLKNFFKPILLSFVGQGCYPLLFLFRTIRDYPRFLKYALDSCPREVLSGGFFILLRQMEDPPTERINFDGGRKCQDLTPKQ